MILGIGIDVVAVDRVRRILNRWQDRFLSKVFTPAEISYAMSRPDPSLHLASRLAAKEAAFKALAPLNIRPSWKEIEVVRDNREPTLNLNSRFQKTTGRIRFHISLTHDGPVAVGMVVVETIEADPKI